MWPHIESFGLYQTPPPPKQSCSIHIWWGMAKANRSISAVRGFKSWQDEWVAECIELFNGAVNLSVSFCADWIVYKATFKVVQPPGCKISEQIPPTQDFSCVSGSTSGGQITHQSAIKELRIVFSLETRCYFNKTNNECPVFLAECACG